jgi:benzodiazapine receptor
MIPPWLAISSIAVLVAFVLNRLSPRDIRWFNRLRRPPWLTFEGAIPFIWIGIFISGGWSAYRVWIVNPGTSQTWFLMGCYLLLEVLVLAYTPVMCKLRSLKIGTLIGATGFFWGLFISWLVWPISGSAFALLLPYLLWSPIGTYVTWQMIPLNPMDA